MKNDKKHRYVTLFARATDEATGKDTGQQANAMAELFAYEAFLVSYRGDDYPTDRKAAAPFLKYKRIKRIGKNTELLDEIIFIIKHARKIDVLHMFHMNIGHLICLWIFKILNPKGVSYLRADIDYPSIKGHEKLESWKKKVIHFLHKGTDIVSAESGITCRKYEELFGVKPIYIPMGFVDISSGDECVAESVSLSRKKEKIIMTAGRLGTEQKATEVLLEAYAKTKNTFDWKLVLAGPIDDKFKSWVEDYYKKHEDLRDRIIFTGNITDKSVLYDWMERSVVFALPSRWGAAETVLVEALSRGAYLVMSDAIPPYPEYTDNGKYGSQVAVDNIDAWAEAIDSAVTLTENGYDCEGAAAYGRATFNWKTIAMMLNKEIMRKKHKKI